MIEIIIALIVMAFICEFVDASLGMGYGTILSPTLILMGYSPLLVVPSILASQAIGGFIAAIFHNRQKNITVNKESRDTKVITIITLAGILATILGAILAVSVPKQYVTIYIGIMVTLIGALILSGKHFNFSWGKIIGLGAVSAFNKGISGGGYGPIVTGGQVVVGNEGKSAIGCTTAAEAPICIAAFIVFVIAKGFPDLGFMLPLIAGAAMAAPIAPSLTKKLNPKVTRWVLGGLILVLGLLTVFKIISP